MRDGGSFEIHREPAEDEEYWRVYITGQYEIARLSAQEVAKAIKLPAQPTALLDVAGAHGWFSAELCKRHETLQATVARPAGSARVGREIIASAGMSDRVEHRDGDMFESDLGGPYDGALVFDIIHHLSAEQVVVAAAPRARGAEARRHARRARHVPLRRQAPARLRRGASGCCST